MDASAFIHRAFHAIRHLTTRDGRPTGAVYGFTATLLKLLKDKQPEGLAVAFDSRGPGRRHQLYPAYKANRPPMDAALATQQEVIRQVVEGLALFRLERPGLEADDLIAALTRQLVGQGREVVIVSSDKDFYQLLGPQVSMYDPDPKKESALTADAFRQRFGLEPPAFLDMQALMGDSSDNIPGVPQVGEKTAQKLIARFGSLDNLFERLTEVTPEKLRDNLAAHREDAYLSRELASLGHGAPVECGLAELRPGPLDRPRLAAIFEELEFSRLLKELPPERPLIEGWEASPAPPAPARPVQTARPAHSAQPVTFEHYRLVDNPEAWAELMSELAGATMLSVDLETDSLGASRCRLVGLSLCATPGRSFYLPVSHQTLGARNQPWETVAEKIGPCLTDPALPKVGQNAKFDWLILARYGLDLPTPADDPMLASYLLNPGSRHNMDDLSKHYLDHCPIPFKEMVPDSKKNFGDLTPENSLNYAAEDADVTLRLAGALRRELQAEPELMALYQEVELPLESLLVRMEKTGVLIDPAALGRLSDQLGQQLKIMETEIFKVAGHPFNIGSPKQLAEVLFIEQGLTRGKKTAKKTGYSTDDAVLAELDPNHPLPRLVREWRSLGKLKSTYTDKLPREINPETGRIHTTYNQTLTTTGRLSSSDPNLQNIPVRDHGRLIRSAFIAPPGQVIVAADYSQIELRLLAHFSQDEALLRAFARDEDIHTQTAVEIFGLPPGEISANLRREAKTINFGVVYGQGAFALGKQLGIPQAQAKSFIDRYFARFPGVRRFLDETRQQARETGLVTTWYGRRRFLPGLNSGGYQDRQEAERMATNTPIQGTAADIIKMAMLQVETRLRREYPQARLIMQVHDELVLEVPEALAPEVSELLRVEMAAVAQKPPLTGARPLTTPLKVEVGHGPSWSAAH
jgi:DNA polymerase-1